jgi:hypothetical protein
MITHTRRVALWQRSQPPSWFSIDLLLLQTLVRNFLPSKGVCMCFILSELRWNLNKNDVTSSRWTLIHGYLLR